MAATINEDAFLQSSQGKQLNIVNEAENSAKKLTNQFHDRYMSLSAARIASPRIHAVVPCVDTSRVPRRIDQQILDNLELK